MQVNSFINCNKSGFAVAKSTISKPLFCIFLGIVFGTALSYALITQFYFYQAVVAGILCLPFIFVFLVYSPRQSLLSLLVLTIPFNPSFHIIRDQSFAFSMGLDFFTSDLVVILIFIYLLISSVTRTRERHNSPASIWHLGLPLLLWIIAGVISFIPAVNESIAIIELIRMLRIFLIFIAIYKLVDKPEDFRLIAVSLVIAFAIQAALVSMEYYTGHPILRLPGEMRTADIAGSIFRPSGSMGHSSNFAKLAALCLPICLAYIYVSKKNIWRIIAGLILVGGLVSLIFTVSRAGLLTSIFGLVWVSLLILTSMRRKAVKIMVPIIFLFIGIGLAWSIGGSRLVSRVQMDYGSALSRPQMFSVAWNVIKNHPFLGVGLNNYTLVAPYYDNTPGAISINFPHPVHNIFLLNAAEMGILGAAFFIWFLFGAISKAFKYASDARFLLDSALAKAVGIGITCSWLQGLIGWGFRGSIIHASYLAIIAGALAALSYSYRNPRRYKNSV